MDVWVCRGRSTRRTRRRCSPSPATSSRGRLLKLEVQLAQLLALAGTVVVIDLAAVRSCDPAGLAMLDACRRAAVVAGVDVRLAAPSSVAGHALRRGGLLDAIAVFRTVDAAVRGDTLDRLNR